MQYMEGYHLTPIYILHTRKKHKKSVYLGVGDDE